METTAQETMWIEINLIDLPSSSRQHDQDRINTLAQDMAKNGQLQEIVVTPKGDRYEVVAGVGRLAAAKELQWDKIRCFVRPGLSDFDKLFITFSENEEREDVSPIYQASLLKKMKGDMTQEQLADKIGKERGTISQYLMI